MRGFRSKTSGLVLLFSSLSLLSGSAFAASPVSQASSLTTSPVVVDLNARPGSPITTTLQIENNSPSSENISLKLEEFRAFGDNGQAQIYKPPSSDPSLSWVHFSKNNFIAEPGVWQQVTMTVNLPSNSAFGYYYAVLVNPNTSVKTKANASVKGSNAIFVLVDANSGNDQRKLEASQFVSIKKVYTFLPATFNIKVHNVGNIFVVPTGDVYISRGLHGKTMDSLPINTGGGNVLPQTNRVFSVSWTNGFPVYNDKKIDGQVVANKQGKPETYLNWNLSSSISKFRFGKYYAHLELVYNNGTTDIPVSAVVSFWVIPWTIILEIIFAIIVFVLIWKYFSKSLRIAWRKARGKPTKPSSKVKAKDETKV
jgi:hypothetical protein